MPGPNAVRHVDGNHKMIRWRLVIHGAIDGYSRTIVFLKCANNNLSSTVMSSFSAAVGEFGLPIKIRTDLGGETVEIWRFMVEQHNDDSAVITGSSTHNERIERLWRDVNRCVSSVYCEIFTSLEEEGRLDCLNEVDLYCIHYSFIPRINDVLRAFKDSWNNHPVSSARNMTPNQFFIQGCVEFNIIPDPGTSQMTLIQHTYPNPTSHVEVPGAKFQPCINLQRLLSTRVNTVMYNDISGDVYLQTVRVVGQHLTRGCNNCVVLD